LATWKSTATEEELAVFDKWMACGATSNEARRHAGDKTGPPKPTFRFLPKGCTTEDFRQSAIDSGTSVNTTW
jgi:hypothetical protein